MNLKKTRAAIALATGALALSACGDGPAPDTTGEQSGGSRHAATFGHVHSLGVDPSDGSLLIATHTGLYRAGDGQQDARRVGERTSDFMGFTVVGPGRFVASGHPSPQESGPPHLGLIESTDGGQTWRDVSRRGESDFHALAVSGRHVYGFDSTSGRVLASRDSGRTWSDRHPPAPVHDLAIAPGDPARLLAGTAAGIALSRDEGRTWRIVDDRRTGLLAWPAADELFLVDGGGAVAVSRDEGRSFQPTGRIGGAPAAFMAHAGVLYAALEDGTIKQSRDSGHTWSVRVGG